MGRRKLKGRVPKTEDLIIPTLKAIIDLGGSGTIEEINEKVYQIAKIDQKALEIPHGKGYESEVDYRIAWARTFLKKIGLIENSARGVWVTRSSNINIGSLNGKEIIKQVEEKFWKLDHKKNQKKFSEKYLENIEHSEEIFGDWKELIYNKLMNLAPEAFERLAKRILRESGFYEVEVTGSTNDGGIDGKGLIRIGNFLTFRVVFQCKRFKNSITPSQIRDFRGAMEGRAERGLFITTGKFTRDAVKEAARDGATQIDLIDGERLCDLLKELKLGVSTENIEKIKINDDFFENL